MKTKTTLIALAVTLVLTGAAYGQSSSSTSQGVGTSNANNQNLGNGASTSSSSTSAGASSQTTGNSVGVTVQQDFSAPGSQVIENRSSGSSTLNINENQNVNHSGTQTLKNVPNVIAPNILPTSPCMGSSSLGGSVAGFGIGGGMSWKDADCGYRETARVFMQAGKMDDGIAVLCASEYAAAAPVCKAMAKKAADEAARPVVASARQEMIRTGNDAGRNATTNGTMSKSQFDREVTVALMSNDKVAQCDVYRRTGDTILAGRMGCVGK